VTFQAAPTGGVAPYSYRWSLQSAAGTVVLANWSTVSSYQWTAAGAGTYTLVVEARSGDATSDAAQATNALTYEITAPAPPPPAPNAPPNGVAMGPSMASPQAIGTALVWTAAAYGGVGPYDYQWYIQNGTGPMQLVRGWSHASTFDWTPTAAGTYVFTVWARSAGVTADAAQASASTTFEIAAPAPPAPQPVAAVSLAADRPSPQNAGAIVTFQAAPTGGVAPHSYRWSLQSGAGTIVLANWSTSSSYQWTAAEAGIYTLVVEARSGDAASDAAQATNALTYEIAAPAPPPPAPNAPPNGVAMGPSMASPQEAGTALVWTAAAYGGVGPYDYQWYIQNGTGPMQLVRGWNHASTFEWTPATAGTYVFTVWARSAGVTADAAQALTSASFTVTAPAASTAGSVQAPASVSLQADRPTPQLIGTPIVLASGATGGVSPYEYVWFAQRDGEGPILLKGWSRTSSVVWTPTEPGAYRVTVAARSHGETSTTPQVIAELAYAIYSPVAPLDPPPTTSSRGPGNGNGVEKTNNGRGNRKSSEANVVSDINLSSDVARLLDPSAGGSTANAGGRGARTASQGLDPSAMGRPNGAPEPAPAPPAKVPVSAVTLSHAWSGALAVGTTGMLTAAAQGGAAPYEYQWYLVEGNGTWRVVKSWSTSATFQLSPVVAGAYGVGVWARSAGMTEAQAYAERRFATVPAPITPMTSATIRLDKASGQPGSRVTVSASGTGGVPRYEYRFWLRKDGGAWQSLRGWSDVDAATVTMPRPGSYTFAVWARSAGTKVDEPQTYAERAFVVK
jgi:hypothetical protein